MKKFIPLVLFLLFFEISNYAQSDFKKGYIITNNNDTVFGLIDFKSQIKSTLQCKFKKTDNDATISYTPNNIKGYRILDGKYYVSRNIKIDTTHINLFIEFLVNGIANLYYYKDERGEHFLIEKKQGEFAELNEIKKIVTYKGDNYESTNKKFIGRLKYEFQEAPDLFPEIDNSEFTKKSMIKVVVDYHQKVCKDGKCIVFEKKMKKIMLNFGILAGLNYNKLIIPKGILITDRDSYLANSKFNDYSFLSIGGYLNLSMPELNDFFSLQYEINYSTINHHGEFPDLLSTPLKKHTQKLDYSTTSLQHIFMVNYNLSSSKITPTIHLGIFDNQIISQTSSRQSIAYSGDKILYHSTPSNIQLSNNFGYIGGIGLEYSQIGKRSIRTELLYQFSNSSYYETTTISLNFMFDLTKTKKN